MSKIILPRYPRQRIALLAKCANGRISEVASKMKLTTKIVPGIALALPVALPAGELAVATVNSGHMIKMKKLIGHFKKPTQALSLSGLRSRQAFYVSM